MEHTRELLKKLAARAKRQPAPAPAEPPPPPTPDQGANVPPDLQMQWLTEAMQNLKKSPILALFSKEPPPEEEPPPEAQPALEQPQMKTAAPSKPVGKLRVKLPSVPKQPIVGASTAQTQAPMRAAGARTPSITADKLPKPLLAPASGKVEMNVKTVAPVKDKRRAE